MNLGQDLAGAYANSEWRERFQSTSPHEEAPAWLWTKPGLKSRIIQITTHNADDSHRFQLERPAGRNQNGPERRRALSGRPGRPRGLESRVPEADNAKPKRAPRYVMRGAASVRCRLDARGIALPGSRQLRSVGAGGSAAAFVIAERLRSLIRGDPRLDLRSTVNVGMAPEPFARKCWMMSPAQCRAARALIDWTQPRLAHTAGLGLTTIVDYERERRAVSEGAITSIQRALEAAGVEFTDGGQPGVRLSATASYTGGAIDAAEPNIERRPIQASGKKGSDVQDGNLTRRALVETVSRAKAPKGKTRP